MSEQKLFCESVKSSTNKSNLFWEVRIFSVNCNKRCNFLQIVRRLILNTHSQGVQLVECFFSSNYDIKGVVSCCIQTEVNRKIFKGEGKESGETGALNHHVLL